MRFDRFNHPADSAGDALIDNKQNSKAGDTELFQIGFNQVQGTLLIYIKTLLILVL